MRIGILTIFPELFRSFLETSLIGRARQAGRLDVGFATFATSPPTVTGSSTTSPTVAVAAW
jgi:hypothetical protein